MAVRAVNFKLDEREITDIRKVASVFHMTMTDVVKEAVAEYVRKMEQDPYYKLTENVEEASEQESKEILDAIDSLSDDDLNISTVRHFGKEGEV